MNRQPFYSANKVFADSQKAEQYSREFSVVNLHHENSFVRLRIVADTAPSADARTVQPGLEDLFLYYFGEEGKSSNEELPRSDPSVGTFMGHCLD